MNEQDMLKDAFEELLLPEDPEAHVEVEPGSADYWHVIAVSKTFEGQPMTKRNSVTQQALRKLGPMLALRVTIAMLLTPDEYEDVRLGQRIFAGA